MFLPISKPSLNVELAVLVPAVLNDFKIRAEVSERNENVLDLSWTLEAHPYLLARKENFDRPSRSEPSLEFKLSRALSQGE
jgi:hypothetical protein